MRIVIRIFLLAILFRVLIMPFFTHSDLKQNNYSAYFLKQGVVDIYSYIPKSAQNLVNSQTFVYPPAAYFTYGLWQIISSPFLGKDYQNWLNDWSGEAFSSGRIFRYLFILKIPYLLFDLSVAVLLYKIVDEKYKKNVLILWLFNPFTIYIIYLFSNFDIIPTFFTLVSLYFLKNKSYLKSGLSLGFGCALKLFPVIVLPLFLIYLLKKEKFKSFINFLFGFLLILLPLTLPWVEGMRQILTNNLTNKVSGLSLNFLAVKLPVTHILSVILLIIFYFKMGNWKTLNNYIFLALLLPLVVSVFHPQWFIWFLPFYFITACENIVLLLLLIPFFIFFILYLLTFKDVYLLLGLTVPVIPTIIDTGVLHATFFSFIPWRAVVYGSRLLLVICTIISILEIFFNKFKFKLDSFLKNESRFLIICLFLVLIFILTLVSSSLLYDSKKILVDSQPVSGEAVPVYKGHNYAETINKNFNDINLIQLKLKNVNLRNKDPFILSLNTPSGEVLKEVTVNGTNFGDDEWVSFKFPPLSTKQPMVINLNSPTVSSESSVLVTTNRSKENIMYKIYRTGTFSEKFFQLFNRISSKLSEDIYFSIFYFSLMVILSFFLIRLNKQPMLK